MFEWASLVMPAVLCISAVISFQAYLTSSEKRHRLTLEFDRKKSQEELDTALTKARIYADKDRDIARLETSVLSGVDENPNDLNSLISSVMQNPELLTNVLEKLKK